MAYIKKLFDDIYITSMGFPTKEDLQEGWMEYDGDVPKIEDPTMQYYRMVNGKIIIHTRELDLSEKVQKYTKYLNDTDYKMLPNYVPKKEEDLQEIISKRNEAREFLRENLSKVQVRPS